ncbi:alpha/beta-hydrolase N-terminal domain-containing protein [Streptomyces sp. NPDC008122]|uniref:alpha/beta-hydrolase N-terminal domain-containing protein n=1 Tax=Streptomyces sp. NPDC008122 TaxID=3364810 RepID=UPI0036E6E314
MGTGPGDRGGPAPGPSPRSRRRRTSPGSDDGDSDSRCPAAGPAPLACLPFAPSPLPRGSVLQGLIAGISGAIGYGLGVIAAVVWRAFANRARRIRHGFPGHGRPCR